VFEQLVKSVMMQTKLEDIVVPGGREDPAVEFEDEDDGITREETDADEEDEDEEDESDIRATVVVVLVFCCCCCRSGIVRYSLLP